MDEKPLTLADIAEPIPSDGTVGFRIRRGARKGLQWLLPNSMMRSITRGGMHYIIPNFTAIVADGYEERRQLVFFFNEARRRGARVFLDVGAHFGYYSLLAARLGIFDEIHAFEPHPKTYKWLLRHIKLNNFEGVITPHNVAASDKDGELLIHGMQIHDKDSAPADSIAIKAVPLDSIFDFRGQNICLKIDVEGHETAALDGAKNLLANNKPFMQIEIWHENTPLIADMLARGYSLIGHYKDDFYFVK